MADYQVARCVRPLRYAPSAALTVPSPSSTIDVSRSPPSSASSTGLPSARTMWVEGRRAKRSLSAPARGAALHRTVQVRRVRRIQYDQGWIIAIRLGGTELLHRIGQGKLGARQAGDKVTAPYLTAHLHTLQVRIQQGPVRPQFLPFDRIARDHSVPFEQDARQLTRPLIW